MRKQLFRSRTIKSKPFPAWGKTFFLKCCLVETLAKGVIRLSMDVATWQLASKNIRLVISLVVGKVSNRWWFRIREKLTLYYQPAWSANHTVHIRILARLKETVNIPICCTEGSAREAAAQVPLQSSLCKPSSRFCSKSPTTARQWSLSSGTLSRWDVF